MSHTADVYDDAITYSFQPRLIGGPIRFRLGEHSLEWTIGGRGNRIAYPMIGRVRLSFKPTNIGGRRFTAEIWPRGGIKLEVNSASVGSLLRLTDHGPEYRIFMQELHRRLANAGGDCRFEAGFAAWRWWPAMIVTVGMAAAIAFVGLRSIFHGEFGGALLVAAFAGLFMWQMLPLVLRNRPRVYSPTAIPDEVLP